ncbi:hypothetical protein BSKO_06102 [Bryopsis sp. KO-2023]|nr:hypothetical protein BSKO_06102 [Bryopsis sp. KO-2023]
MGGDSYEGSSSSCDSTDFDIEMLDLYTSRVDRCRRSREKLRKLARKHNVCLAEIDRESANIKAVKNAALEAVEAKRRVLEAELNRRYSAAVAAIMLNTEERKLPLKRRKNALKRSQHRIDASMEALEQKMIQRQQKFLHNYVQLLNDIDGVIEGSSRLVNLENIPRTGRRSAALEDFRNLTLKSTNVYNKKTAKHEDLDGLHALMKCSNLLGDDLSD